MKTYKAYLKEKRLLEKELQREQQREEAIDRKIYIKSFTERNKIPIIYNL